MMAVRSKPARAIRSPDGPPSTSRKARRCGMCSRNICAREKLRISTAVASRCKASPITRVSRNRDEKVRGTYAAESQGPRRRVCRSVAADDAVAGRACPAGAAAGQAIRRTPNCVAAFGQRSQEGRSHHQHHQYLLKAYEPDKIAIEVVTFGPGIDLLRSENPNRQRVESLIAQGVKFDVCLNTVD